MGMAKNCDNCIYSGRPSYEYPCTVCVTAYDNAPSKWESAVSTAADMVEVVHGEWEFGELGPLGTDVRCSNCGWGCENVDPILWVTYPGHKFCGACGAKMDG